jgi:hypothetical protein
MKAAKYDTDLNEMAVGGGARGWMDGWAFDITLGVPLDQIIFAVSTARWAFRSMENFLLYETRARFYLVSYSTDKSRWRVLKISRSEATELDVSEDPVEYTERQAAALLHTIAEGNGGLPLLHRACACVGAIRFLEGYYLLLITQRRQVGMIAGHAVYTVEASEVCSSRVSVAGLAKTHPAAGGGAAPPRCKANAQRRRGVRREVRSIRRSRG